MTTAAPDDRSTVAARGQPTDTPASTTGAVVELDHVTKRYGPPGTPPAVNELSLTIPAGEICVLVGPSGCGKTTTMKMINRLVEPTSGRLTIDGRDVMQLSPVDLRRQIGYVIQQVGLFPHMTVGDNTGVVPRLLRWPVVPVVGRAVVRSPRGSGVGSGIRPRT